MSLHAVYYNLDTHEVCYSQYSGIARKCKIEIWVILNRGCLESFICQIYGLNTDFNWHFIVKTIYGLHRPTGLVLVCSIERRVGIWVHGEGVPGSEYV